ncbi:MAG: SDR family oxidoreductase [candidate division KSB1 bacterium]|nr:SDR family oxidoreductase [candidate division KSB1 bacterium]MDZ7276182.1 SDR family oxidoreductase [candidate division KSB1 bacterium]MDZ7287038.1 SDR family oxidoreductase [candidate division KSB1 bacterium]MDZ7297037.1 SDR family oxidoreductase [candidate division KSB1 bacterium]MDZ7307202.1 SDR family oxidoreductase [candidate division KSB1 bacterium]
MSKDWFDLRHRVIILTGGAGLLGREYARALSQAGAHVVVADIDARAAREVVAELPGAEGLAVATDVTQPASVHALVRQTLAKFERVDGLVNNAALDPKFDAGQAHRHNHRFENYPLELWQRSLAVDLTGMFLCSQAVALPMLEQRRGVIVNIASIYGLVGPDQRIYQRPGEDELMRCKPVSYSVTKSAVLGFTRYLATYWAGKGIRVNTLTLGGVQHEQEPEFVQRYQNRVPLGRMAGRGEYCGALIFLLSEASAYMTGANLVVDGGWTAW